MSKRRGFPTYNYLEAPEVKKSKTGDQSESDVEMESTESENIAGTSSVNPGPSNVYPGSSTMYTEQFGMCASSSAGLYPQTSAVSTEASKIHCASSQPFAMYPGLSAAFGPSGANPERTVIKFGPDEQPQSYRVITGQSFINSNEFFTSPHQDVENRNFTVEDVSHQLASDVSMNDLTERPMDMSLSSLDISLNTITRRSSDVSQPSFDISNGVTRRSSDVSHQSLDGSINGIVTRRSSSDVSQLSLDVSNGVTRRSSDRSDESMGGQ